MREGSRAAWRQRSYAGSTRVCAEAGGDAATVEIQTLVRRQSSAVAVEAAFPTLSGLATPSLARLPAVPPSQQVAPNLLLLRCHVLPLLDL